jgi:hypothetical protein
LIDQRACFFSRFGGAGGCIGGCWVVLFVGHDDDDEMVFYEMQLLASKAKRCHYICTYISVES